MGILKQGILGGFKNKVGPVIGSSWKGRAVMRSMPLSVANPKTAGQVQQRSRFKQWTMLASALLSSVIVELCNRFAGSISGFNYFVKENLNLTPGTLQSLTSFFVSHGKLGAPSFLNVSRNMAGINFTYGTMGSSPYDLPSDILYLGALSINPDGTLNDHVIQSSSTRADWSDGASATIQLDDVSTGGKYVLYATFLRADGTQIASNFSIVLTAS